MIFVLDQRDPAEMAGKSSGRATGWPAMGDHGGVNCDVAREALSARIDGEREPVPSARVDEHLRGCRWCAAWHTSAQEQAGVLRSLAGGECMGPAAGEPEAHRVATGDRLLRWCRRHGLRAALAVAGLVQVAIAVVQAAGADFGVVAAHHGAATGAHLLNESTAWCAALGTATVVAAFRPAVTAGLAFVLVTYVGLLSCYVIADATAGQVTAARIASHAPVVAAAVLAALVWQTGRRHDPPPEQQRADADRSWPANVRRLRRPLPYSDGSAA